MSERTTLTINVAGRKTPVIVTSDSTVDLVRKRGHVLVDLSRAPDLAPFKTLAHVIDGPIGYMLVRPQQRTSRPWVRVDYDRVSRKASDRVDRVTAGSLGSPNPADPSRIVTQFSREIRDVEQLDDERMFGLPVQRYRGWLPTPAVLTDAGLDPQTKAAMTDALEPRFTVDLWVDDAQLPRRIRVANRGQGATLVQDTQLHNYGAPVRITRPRRSQIRPLRDYRTFSDLADAGERGRE